LVFEKAAAKSGKVAAAPTGPAVEQEELDEELMSANKFKEFSHLFENMTVETRFITDQKFVVDVIIANDGDKILALVMVNEEHYQVLIYKAHESIMIQQYDIQGTYIKAATIQ